MKLKKYIRLFIMTTDDVKQFDIDKIAPTNKRSNFKYMDDEKIIMNASKIGWAEVIVGTCFLACLLYAYHQTTDESIIGNHHDKYSIIGTICFGVMDMAMTFMILHGFSGYFKKFELNRKNGTITYPNPFFASTIKFSKAKFFFGANTGLYTDPIQVALEHGNGYTWSYMGQPAAAYFSFYVWYMDKNRPLPPGTAFDAFREKDEKRRLEEGFPDYLYPSVLPINDPNREAYLKEHPKEEEPKYYPDEVDVVPAFDGNINTWLLFNKDVPQTDCSSGGALLFFCIEKDGTINLIKLLGDVKEIDRELARLVLSMPPWKPGRKDGKTVRVIYIFHLDFTYPKDRDITYNLWFYPLSNYNRDHEFLSEVTTYIY